MEACSEISHRIVTIGEVDPKDHGHGRSGMKRAGHIKTAAVLVYHLSGKQRPIHHPLMNVGQEWNKFPLTEHNSLIVGFAQKQPVSN